MSNPMLNDKPTCVGFQTNCSIFSTIGRPEAPPKLKQDHFHMKP